MNTGHYGRLLNSTEDNYLEIRELRSIIECLPRRWKRSTWFSICRCL